MKKIYLVSAALLFSCVAFTQTLFTIANEPVSKDEFLRAYNKNKAPGTENAMTPSEYLELYKRFKLKVKAAKDMKLDTLPQLKYETQNFKNQIQDGYLNDEKGVNKMVDEAFVRNQKELHVMHFFVKLNEKMQPTDTIKAWKALNEIREEIEKKKVVDYDELVEEVSNEYYPVKAYDLGFISAFQIPYEFENIVYSLKIGEVNRVYRSKTGIHIFRLLEERKSSGRWKVAQILLAFPPGDATPYIKPLGIKADSIYNALVAGANFAKMAQENSDDKLTYQTGGEMPEFGVGKYELPFEKKVFALEKNGDIARPFFTEFGYHIIKRLGVTPTPTTKNDAAYLYELKQKVNADVRINIAREKFTKDVIKQIGLKRSTSITDKDLFAFADTVSKNPSFNTAKSVINKKTLYNIGSKIITGGNWLSFIKDYKTNGELYQGESNNELLEKYTNLISLEYYKNNLEKYNPDFSYQIKEFKEGNMLFEIMERNVWSAASADEAGLKNYYNNNKTKYQWAASADVLVFNCASKEAATKIMQEVKAGKNWSSYAAEVNGTTQADSGRYELSQLPLLNGKTLIANTYSDIAVSNDGTASFVYVIKNYAANMQRSFDEAKGLVINDYQSVVEEKWIDQLKKKYAIKVNDAVFKTIAN